MNFINDFIQRLKTVPDIYRFLIFVHSVYSEIKFFFHSLGSGKFLVGFRRSRYAGI